MDAPEFATCPACFACYPRFSIHACLGPTEQKHFVGLAAQKIASTPPADVAPSPKTDRIAFLERKREATKADLLLKFEDGDHHGVADAAMDLRDIESELKGLRY